MAVPFLFVFVAGIAADLLETRHREIALAAIWGLLVANAAWNLWELARVGVRVTDRHRLMLQPLRASAN